MYRKEIVKLTPHARFSTLCLHAGQEPDPSTGAIVTPIYQSVKFEYPTVAETLRARRLLAR